MNEKCDGLPDKPCPFNKSGGVVRWTGADVWNCEKCDDIRFNTSRMPSAESIVMLDESIARNKIDLVESELLLFAKEKSDSLPMDRLINICVNYYSENEIIAARDLMDQFTPKRLPKRKGVDKLRTTMEDIIKAFGDPNIKLPKFCMTKTTRIPIVDIKNCDASAILTELQSLRSEVRKMNDLKDELNNARHQLDQVTLLREEVSQLKSKLTESPIPSQFLCKKVMPVPTLAANTHSNTQQAPGSKSFASLARDLQSTSVIELQSPASKEKSNHHRSESNKKRTPMIRGKNTDINNLTAADSDRRIEIFVSRLQPGCSKDEVEALAKTVVPTATNVQAKKLQTRFESYSSFHLTILVKRSMFENSLQRVYSEDSWSEGLIVRRYFNHSNGGK